MKKRIFAGILLAFILMLSALPCFAEAVDAAPVEEAPAEEAVAEEELQVEEVPTEPAPAPEAPKFEASSNLTLKEAFYNNDEKAITFTIANNTKDEQDIILAALEFDTAKIEVTADMQNILPSSIAPQMGIEMADGVIIFVQKPVLAGKELTVKFPATVADYKADALPQIKLAAYVQTVSGVLDLTKASDGGQAGITFQSFDNILTVGKAGGFSFAFLKDNLLNIAVILLWIIVLAMIIVMAVSKSSCKKTADAETEDVEDTEEFAETAEDAEFMAEDDEAADDEAADDEEGDIEDEEVQG
ncbi:MAG: hypothetical protein IJN96_02205 [Clostridia bacterium]|nr:hypothetical protein [Clostridia bacterium]